MGYLNWFSENPPSLSTDGALESTSGRVPPDWCIQSQWLGPLSSELKRCLTWGNAGTATLYGLCLKVLTFGVWKVREDML